MSDESAPGGDFFATEETRTLRQVGLWASCAIVASSVARVWTSRPPFLKSFDAIRRFAVNIFIITIALLFGVVIFRATTETITVVDPISVPKQLEEAGYSGTIIAQHLIDQVALIGEKAATRKERVRFGRDSRFANLGTIEVPSSGLTVRSLVWILRDLFAVEDNRIGGEILVQRPAASGLPTRYALTLRFDRRVGRTISVVEADNVEELLVYSARAVIREFDPYVLASYLREMGADREADRVIENLFGSTD